MKESDKLFNIIVYSFLIFSIVVEISHFKVNKLNYIILISYGFGDVTTKVALVTELAPVRLCQEHDMCN